MTPRRCCPGVCSVAAGGGGKGAGKGKGKGHMVDGPDSAWRNRAPGPHRNRARQAMDSRQKAATRGNMQREERVTAQGPVKEQQPDGMSHRGSQRGGGCHMAATGP